MTTTRPTSDMELGVPGFRYADLHDVARLRDLLDAFDAHLAAVEPALSSELQAYRACGGEGMAPQRVSAVITGVGPRVSEFVARLFRIEAERGLHARDLAEGQRLFQFKAKFLRERVGKRLKAEAVAGASLPDLAARVGPHLELAAAHWGKPDREEACAALALHLMEIESSGATSSYLDEAKRRGLVPDDAAGLLALLEKWCFLVARSHGKTPLTAGWVSFHKPEPVDHAKLVEVEHPDPSLPERMKGPAWRHRRRDGFKLTDPRFSPKEVHYEVDYCVLCHERDKDTCSKGILEKGGGFKKNPLAIPLTGCPLDEKISEAHQLRTRGDSMAALAAIMIDNPMAPGTGHRICNDCMKACIFQKQDPVNIPQIETRILTDVLALPWGFEIYGLLSRWNPLNPRRPVPLPYNGKNVLVVGLGPAGYTLAHYLSQEGFGVVGIDGLKLEPLAPELYGGDGQPPRPVRDYRELCAELDDRILAGFGGVSEYGITVRWDKNFLNLIYLSLLRRDRVQFYGGVRFGGTLEIDDAWARGFHHVAIAAGAGKPTVLDIPGGLTRGIRTASDFLMALQLTGAAKRTSIANLQVRLPAVVIGGGLTAIDTATELLAYYPLMVEKTLHRFEHMAAAGGEERIFAILDEEEKGILRQYLEHGRAVRAARAAAAAVGELPDLAALVQGWGGVTIAYRKGMIDSPAYRLNHEEIIKALEEGIHFVENISPVEATADRFGAVESMTFERQQDLGGGKWKSTGERLTLAARSVMVAAGTVPNIVYEREHPGTFALDERKAFFKGHVAEGDGAGGFRVTPAERGGPAGFFTSYAKDGRLVSYYGDNHPRYAGNVVKAMASARDGYREVVRLFASDIAALDPAAQPARDEAWRKLVAALDGDLCATVVRVDRLTPTIVEVVVRAPMAARRFRPGQFYRLQNYETTSRIVDGTRLQLEGIALTGAWVDAENGLLSMIALELGVSSRLCQTLTPGEPVIVMGPTGAPTEIPEGETVLLAGGGLGNAVLFSIAKGLRERGNKVLYFAGYKNGADVFKRDEIEAATDQVIWSVDRGEPIAARRPQDRSFVGNIVQAMIAYTTGQLGGPPAFPLHGIHRIIAIGSDRMMAAVKAARHDKLKEHLGPHTGIGSINSIMQCMMKEVCGQCLQAHVDPQTGLPASVVFTCFNQDQPLDAVDFTNLNSRLRTNAVLEKLSNLWLDHLWAKAGV